MAVVNKIDLSRQVEIKYLTEGELNDVLNLNESTLFKDINGELFEATKVGENNIDITGIGGNSIRNLPIPPYPTVFPLTNQAYALGAVRDGSNFTLAWVLVTTLQNYNDESGTGTTTGTTYSIVSNSPVCLVDFNGSLVGNGRITIYNYTGLNLQYSIDNGLNYTTLSTVITKVFENLDDGIYDVIIRDENLVIVHTETITLLPIPVSTIISTENAATMTAPTQTQLLKISDIIDGYGTIRVSVTDAEPDSFYRFSIDNVNFTSLSSVKNADFTVVNPQNYTGYVKKYRPVVLELTDLIIDGDSNDITDYSFAIWDTGTLSLNYLSINGSPYYNTVLPASYLQYANKTIYLREDNELCVYTKNITISPNTANYTSNQVTVDYALFYRDLLPASEMDHPNTSFAQGGLISFGFSYLWGLENILGMKINWVNVTQTLNGVLDLTISHVTLPPPSALIAFDVDSTLFTNGLPAPDELQLEIEIETIDNTLLVTNTIYITLT